MQTNRDKLIELIINVDTHDSSECKLCTKDDDACDCCYAEKLADHLLANDVIVPPCKVGQKVWLINNPREYEVLNFHFTGQMLWATLILIEEPTIMREINTDLFGKTVFLTKEEAEAKLKEREGK